MTITASISSPIDEYERRIDIPICVQSTYNNVLEPICEKNELFLLADFGSGVDIDINNFSKFEYEVQKFLTLLEENPSVEYSEKSYLNERFDRLISEMQLIFSKRPNVEFSIG